MSRVIVTVQRAGDPRTRELEVSANVVGTRLAELVSRSLGWDQDPSGDRAVFQIEVLPLGRRLSPDESLASTGALDGSWLIFHQVGTASRPLPPTVPMPLPVFEQIWDPAVDPPTDLGFNWKDEAGAPATSPSSPSLAASHEQHLPPAAPSAPPAPASALRDPPVPEHLLPAADDDQPTSRVTAPPSAPAAIEPGVEPPTSTTLPQLGSVAPATPVAAPASAPSVRPAAPQAPQAEPNAPPFRSPGESPVEQPLRGFRPWRSRRRGRSSAAQPPAAQPSPDPSLSDPSLDDG
jgi:hypothetical protein